MKIELNGKLGCLTGQVPFISLRSSEIIEAIGANKIIFHFKRKCVRLVHKVVSVEKSTIDDFMLLQTTMEPQQETHLKFTDLMNGRPQIMKR